MWVALRIRSAVEEAGHVKANIFRLLRSLQAEEAIEISTFVTRIYCYLMVHKLRGVVIRGNGLGHRLGFPTANIAVAADIPVRDGVYAGEVNFAGTLYRSVVNVGTRPTVGSGGERFAEAHLLDFSDDLYGESVIIFLLEYIRPEQRFASVAELKAQIAEDKKSAEDYFNNCAALNI